MNPSQAWSASRRSQTGFRGSHGLLLFEPIEASFESSADHNEAASRCGNFPLVHKGFTASIEVTY